ncbi:MAG: MaoC family dehydratase [Chloroflexi bacterium]|nr:MaoC family dehydratase [Chloroflexota bacterium]
MAQKVAKLEDLVLGASKRVVRTITAEDNLTYCRLVGNEADLHLSDEHSAETRYGQLIIPGVFTLGMLSAPLTQLGKEVGYRAALAKISADFRKPVKVGDTLTSAVEFVQKSEIKGGRKRLYIKLTVTNQHNELVMEGEMVGQLI